VPRRTVPAACALLAFLSPHAASAIVITCSFTEPFVRTSYDSDLQTLTLTYDVEKRRETQKSVSLHTLSPTVFELWNANNEVIQHLELDHQGSDGMSDRIYPYEVKWTPRDASLPEVLFGGCVRNSKPR
jgi:hypothetical protein